MSSSATPLIEWRKGKITTLEMQTRKNDLKNLLLGASLGIEYRDYVRPGVPFKAEWLNSGGQAELDEAQQIYGERSK